jgi:hypothetical protein
VSISDLNSAATFLLTPPGVGDTVGMNSWTIDGTNQLKQEWFWYRVGPSGPQYSLDSLVLQPPTLGTNSLDVTYADPAGQFSVELVFTLQGGTAGSGTADMGQHFLIHNLGTSPLDFHFFQYTNFDLNGTSAGDDVEIDPLGSNAVDASQYKGTFTTFADSVAQGKPSSVEVGEAATIHAELTGGNYTLDGNAGPATPVDAAWALEWDQSIPAGVERSIANEDAQLTGGLVGAPSVPLPVAAWLGLPGLLAVALLPTLRRLRPVAR